ncbi:MAG: hypothetical protein RIU71_1505, partial [Pseudomonadota bacterium]
MAGPDALRKILIKNTVFAQIRHIKSLQTLEIHQGILIYLVSLREYSHECSQLAL